MASSLSDEEFQRMQTQLLELRAKNYQYEDHCRRKDREIAQFREQVENLDRDLQKAIKTVAKSKKAREFELLMQECDGLQRKLASQEEEFRLQNETLMQELGQLVTVNENLEKENAVLKEGGGAERQTDANTEHLQDEVRRLQAKNSALQKTLTSCQEKHEEDINPLRQTIEELEAQCLKLAGHRGTPVGQVSSDRTVEGQADHELHSEDHTDGLDNQPESTEEPVTVVDNHTEDTNLVKSDSHSRLEDLIKEVNEVRLSLDTEREEKNILKEQLQSVENTYKEQLHNLQQSADKLSEKFKKKQESLVQLQNEKEQLYTDLSKKLEDLQASKESEVNQVNAEADKLRDEVDLLKKVLDELRDKSNQRIQQLEETAATLHGQVNSASLETNQQLSEQNERFQVQLQQLQEKLQHIQRENDDLKVQLKESRSGHHSITEQLYAMQADRDKQIQALQEANRLAEKRKSLLDELAIKYQKESDAHREQLKSTQEQHAQEIEELERQVDDFRNQAADLERTREQVEELQTEIQTLEESKGWLERTLNDTEQSFHSTKTQLETTISVTQEDHEGEVKNLKEEHSQQIQSMEEQLAELGKEKDEQMETITKLKQDIKDGLDDKKLHEKKGMSVLKDLKRQLHSERKRSEKLQERLQEILAESKDKLSVDDLFRSSERTDTSSLSSWSASGLSRDTNSAMSPDEETPPTSILEQENANLLCRLTEAQQQMWTLEAKVNHLEESNAAMADDLLRKTAVIDHYIMNSRLDSTPAGSPSNEKITLKRVVDFMKGDENQRDMNRKLQRMLEETLTKNMHLEQDLETLSQELVRLSKKPATANPVTTSDPTDK